MKLRKGQAAIVWTPKGGYSANVPVMQPDDEVPEPILALMACMVRLNDDPAFYRRQVDWLRTIKARMEATTAPAARGEQAPASGTEDTPEAPDQGGR